MKPPNLLGSRVKLDRAKDLGDALEDKVLATIGFVAPTNAITTGHGFNEEMTEYRLWVETIPEIEMLMFGVAIGDVIHDIRSALDHAAWELVSCCGTTGLSEDEERAIQFPIYDTCGKFANNVGRRLPGVPAEYIAMIESMQPYKREHLPQARRFGPPLRKLAALSNLDKHRVVTPVLARGTHVPRFKPNEDLLILDHHIEEGTLDEGTNLVWARVETVGPNPQMKVEGRASFDIALEEGHMVSIALVEMGGEAHRVLTLIDRVSGRLFK